MVDWFLIKQWWIRVAVEVRQPARSDMACISASCCDTCCSKSNGGNDALKFFFGVVGIDVGRDCGAW